MSGHNSDKNKQNAFQILKSMVPRRTHYLLFLLVFAFLMACQPDPATEASSQGTEAIPAPADALFQLVSAEESGINFANRISENHQLNIITNSYMYNGGGVAVLDVNNDGLFDLYFVSSQEDNKLYLNKGGLKFEDITDRAGVAAKGGFKSGVTVVDINGDGYHDLYVCRTGLEADGNRRNLLYLNKGDQTFEEVAASYGLDDISASNHANFFDYDLDGDLDMYLMNHPVDFKTVNNIALELVDGEQVRKTGPRTPYDTDRFYRNDGNGSFTDVTEVAGITNRAFGLSATVYDFNEDGYPDIFIGNDYIDPDFLYLNTGKGGFVESAASFFRHTSNHTMGVDIADLNNDSKPDLVALDMIAEDNRRQKTLMTTMVLQRYNTLVKYGYGHQCMRNILQLNMGDGKFSEIGTLSGISNTDWSWSVLLADYDNDGLKDVYITNGYRRDVSNLDYLSYTVDSLNRTGGITKERFPDFNQFLNLIPSERLQNYVYRNTGDLKFEKASQPWGIVQKSFSNGAAYVDLDNDGDLELVVNNIADPAFVYKNTAVEKGKRNFLQVAFDGPTNNPMGVGAKARLVMGETIQFQELTPVRGFFSSVQPILHFGLGTQNKVDRLEIIWPDNKVQVLENIPGGQRLTVKYQDAKSEPAPPPLNANTLLKANENKGLAFRHQENEFEDFDRERLLPHRLSRLGPALASADVNGDGRQDLFVGGAAGQEGRLYVQNANGTFSPLQIPAFKEDQAQEDVEALFFDAEGDGDMDLYVVSGGNAAPLNSALYQDRLYLNQNGQFTKASDALPRITASGGAVAAHDFDGDGDLDLFVGGRVSPGAYPSAPESYVLQNNGGKFQDITQQVAPDLKQLGMITDMEWADLNGDGQAELVVVGEWLPVSVFSVNAGNLQNATGQFGLNNTEGWWNEIEIADIDADGDLDILAGNLGQNSRLQASPEAPLQLYAKDFDRNGSLDPILTYFNAGKEYPLARREQLLVQLPGIKKKFVFFEPYSTATLTDVFPSNQLEGANKYKAVEFRSGQFVNNGNQFSFQPFPINAQFAPVNAILVYDLNQDGKVDLLLAGNNFQADVETGRYDAGNGTVLLGEGQGKWSYLPNTASGFWATGEVRNLALLPLANGEQLLVVGNNDAALEVAQFK